MKKLYSIYKLDMTTNQYQPISSQNPHLVVNKNQLDFKIDKPDEHNLLPINNKSRDLLCIGNKSKSKIKIQFSTIQSHKYTLEIIPQIFTLEPKKVIEIEFHITPHCTTTILSELQLLSFHHNEVKEYHDSILMDWKSDLSFFIDSDEIEVLSLLGQGSFGIVMKGKYRNDIVAIKTLKETGMKVDELELEKEIEILQKMNSLFIIRFFGVVKSSKGTGLVTELAKYGSFESLIMKIKNVKFNLRVCQDIVNGLYYLHNNGIIHRDLKPDNVLIVNDDLGADVCGKLTDFGSCRTINMMKCNMTFTNGVGTPIYMAPELFIKQFKYSFPIDIYSFALTLYQSFKCNDIYDNKQFPFPWNVIDFVQSGKRLPRLDNMSLGCWKIVSCCWDDDPTKRLKIENLKLKMRKFKLKKNYKNKLKCELKIVLMRFS